VQKLKVIPGEIAQQALLSTVQGVLIEQDDKLAKQKRDIHYAREGVRSK
jgi:hypothetical protein